jgi:hypothetical protein
MFQELCFRFQGFIGSHAECFREAWLSRQLATSPRLAKGLTLKPAEEYDDLSLSVRTTFEAVTHALMTSKLTDANGGSLGTALDVVQYLETVHGKIPESSGDLQFRIYVALKPTAFQTLDASREFKHTGDNTVFHKGYPTNYRQQGGTPSIQFSCTKDGKRADIDVDYHSSKFPKAAVNGHLSSSNSDVRAGNNYVGHVRRWSGFADWWKSIFGVPLKEADLNDEQTKAGRGMIPASPRAGKGKIEEAMYDFLNSWLVEQQPNQAVAYISPKAYSCINQVESDDQKPINPGLVPHYIAIRMKKANNSIGKPASLAEVAESVPPDDPALKPMNQPHSAEFSLFETPDDIALNFDCADRNGAQNAAETAKPERKYGKYFGASLRLKAADAKGATLLVVWEKESGYWKIVSWEVESDKVEHKKTPSLVAAGSDVKLERVTGDPAMIAAAQGFLDDWFVKQNFEEAAGYLSEQCYPCVNLNADEGKEKVRNWAEGRRRIIDGMKNFSNTIGRKNDVTEAMTSVAPSHPILKLVSHPKEQAYTMVSVPDEIASAFECQSRAPGAKMPKELGGPPVYGNYYGAIFELKVQGTPAALRLLWGKEQDQWRVIAYSVEVP